MEPPNCPLLRFSARARQGMSVVEAHNAMVSTGSMQQLLLWIGVFETIIGIPSIIALQEGEREPGDFQFGLAFAPKDPEKFKLKQLAELKVPTVPRSL